MEEFELASQMNLLNNPTEEQEQFPPALCIVSFEKNVTLFCHFHPPRDRIGKADQVLGILPRLTESQNG